MSACAFVKSDCSKGLMCKYVMPTCAGDTINGEPSSKNQDAESRSNLINEWFSGSLR